MRGTMRWMALGVLVTLGTPTWSTAQDAPAPAEGARTHSPAARPRANMGRLNLSAQQRQQAKEMRDVYHKRLADLRCKLRQKKADRQAEMQQPAPDKAKLQALSQEIGQVHGQILVEEANARADFEKILTPKQREEFKKMRSERRGKRAEREDAEVE